MVRERFGPVPVIDEERIARAIELTRFPVPDDDDYAETDTEAGLVRAADLIGQLADPLYLRKLNALYGEFVENGVNEKLGYQSPADLVERYPQFFLEQSRAVYRRRPALSGDDYGRQTVDRHSL